MAQTLRYYDELIAGLPDNSAGLIAAVNIRDMLVSTIGGRGLIENTDNFTIPITSAVWTSINPLLPVPAHTETFWNFDGNNLAFSNYTASVDTIVPAGYTKFVQFMAVVELTKNSGGADVYEVQFSKNAVGIGEPESVEFTEAGVNTVTLLHPLLADVSVPTDVYGVQIQGVGTSDDLECGYFSMQISDSLLLQAP